MYGLGMAFAASGDLDQAEHWFQRSIDEWSSQAMTELGQVLERKGDLAGAEQWYRSAIDDGDVAGIISLGILLERVGAGSQAEALFEGHLGDEPSLTVYLGALHERRGEYDMAETWYRRAVEVAQGAVAHELALHALASLLDARGPAEEADMTRAAFQELKGDRAPVADGFDAHQHQLLTQLARLRELARA